MPSPAYPLFPSDSSSSSGNSTNISPGNATEIPIRREEIIRIEQIEENDKLSRKDILKLSFMASSLLLLGIVLGMLLFALGSYFTSTSPLETPELDPIFREVTTNITLLKKGTIEILLFGENTVTVAPDDLCIVPSIYGELFRYKYTLCSQQVIPMRNARLQKEMDQMIQWGPSYLIKNHNNSANEKKTISDRKCYTKKMERPFSKDAIEPLVIFYTAQVDEEIITFNRTFNLEVNQDRKKAAVMEYVLKKVFKKKGSGNDEDNLTPESKEVQEFVLKMMRKL